MGKRCACDRLFRRLEEDLQFRTLPLAAKMLWLQLARLAASTPGFAGVLQFGSDHRFLTSVALAVTCTEPEVEPNLAALERRGLVRRGDDGTSLILTQVEATSARAEASRINGLQGGRRRKGETLEARRERRQRELCPSPGVPRRPKRNPRAKLRSRAVLVLVLMNLLIQVQVPRTRRPIGFPSAMRSPRYAASNPTQAPRASNPSAHGSGPAPPRSSFSAWCAIAWTAARRPTSRPSGTSIRRSRKPSPAARPGGSLSLHAARANGGMSGGTMSRR